MWRKLRTHRLDIVAVGIDQERRKIARAVIGPGACGAVVAASGLDALGVEFLDRRVVGRAKRDMGAGAPEILVQIEPERRLALWPESRAGLVPPTHDIAERRQSR